MKVVFVLNSLGAGGTERSTAVLLPELAARGVAPTVVCLRRAAEGDEAHVVEQGFDVRFLDGRSVPGQVRRLREILREVSPDVVHTAIFEADMVGRLSAIGTRIPVLSSLVNTPYEPVRFQDPNVRRWRLRLVQRADGWTGRHLTTHFHAVSSGVAGAGVQRLGLDPARITVVERGRADAALGRPSRARREATRDRLGLPPDGKVALAVGRQEFQKGHGVLVDAACRVREQIPGFVCLIAGRSGNASADTERRVAGSDGAVRLLGHRDDVADLLSSADVFVMPSMYEGTAGAALEAMALDVPVVATSVTGVEGVLEDGVNCRLVPVGDEKALSETIIRVFDEPERSRGLVEQARADYESRFGIDRAADGMLSLYRRVAEGGRRPSSGAHAT